MTPTGRWTAALALALALAACHTFRTGPVPGTDADALVRIGVGETVTLDEDRFAISFARVLNDSRCPSGAQCVHEGDAAVGLVLQERGEATRTVELHTAVDPRRVSHEGYVVELVALEPVPVAGQAESKDYVVTLRVRRG